MNARFYVQSTGRFLTADTIVPNPTDPQSLNRYTYTLGNPLNLTDPSGHIAVVEKAGNYPTPVVGPGWTQSFQNWWNGLWTPSITPPVTAPVVTVPVVGAPPAVGPIVSPGVTAGPGVVVSPMLGESTASASGSLQQSAPRAGKGGNAMAGGSSAGPNLDPNDDQDDGVADSPAGLEGEEFENWIKIKYGGTGPFRSGGRQFDGTADNGNTWVEAKSAWNYTNSPEGFQEFRSTAGQQLSIANANGKNFAIYTNSPIPDHVRSWLISKGIPFVEIVE